MKAGASSARFLGALWIGLALVSGCSPHATGHGGASGNAAAKPVPTAKETGDRTPISFVAPRVGDKFIYLTKQRRNRKVYVLRADAEKGQYFGEDTGRSTFVNPHVTFFGSDGKQLTADAPAGVVVEQAKTVLMSGGVHAHTQDGVTLTSDTMVYDDNTQTIHARGNVVMDSAQGSELRGNTLDWSLKTGAVNVSGAH
jgi:hypothetical protein